MESALTLPWKSRLSCRENGARFGVAVLPFPLSLRMVDALLAARWIDRILKSIVSTRN
jgi:hypothetical protein